MGGGHSSQRESIEKSFKQSFNNFIKYLPKFEKAIIWDNTKDFGFTSIEEQLVFEIGKLKFKNTHSIEYSTKLSNTILENREEHNIQQKSRFRN